MAAWREKLGLAPDPDIAAEAGVSMWVVRGYRIKLGIPPYDRWAAGRVDSAGPSAGGTGNGRPKRADARQAPATTTTRERGHAEAAAAPTWLWAVRDALGSTMGYVRGGSLADAVAAIARSGVTDVHAIVRHDRLF